MASLSSPSSVQFIDAALSCTGPYALSYTDPDQKWLIRQHLVSLLQNFPSLRPLIDTFSHNNGITVTLLNARGDLHVSNSTPPISLSIWLHENYPYIPPIVFVSSNSGSQIQQDHPFVDPSGATTSPYLQTWLYPPCNLSDLVHNFVKLFSLIHPFYNSNTSTSTSFTHPSLVSKREAMDRLLCALHYDVIALRTKTEDEIEELSVLQAEMVKRVDITSSMIIALEGEKMDLKNKVVEVTEEADVLMNWVRIHDHKGTSDYSVEDVFEAADEESEVILECLAADRAIEDVMYAMDKAVEEGVVTFEMYIRQVRILARDQFYHRARLVNLNEGSQNTCLSRLTT